MAEDPRDPLERRGPDRHRLDRRADRAPPVDQGVQGGVGERLAEDFEALLAAAHPGQPVVDERHAEARQAPRRVRAIAPVLSDAGVHAGLPGWLSRTDHRGIARDERIPDIFFSTTRTVSNG